jgi:hypothetical protein
MTMEFKAGQTVRVGGKLRRLIRRVNTTGGWQLDREVDGMKFWNEQEMVRSEMAPAPAPKNKKMR